MDSPWLPVVMACGAMVAVVVAWVGYLARIPQGRVQERPVGALVLQGIGIAAGTAAIGLGSAQGARVLAPGTFAIGMGLFFVWLYRQRGVPAGDIQVEVGGELRPFSVRDHTGAPFDASALEGQRVLFKFFRGSW